MFTIFKLKNRKIEMSKKSFNYKTDVPFPDITPDELEKTLDHEYRDLEKECSREFNNYGMPETNQYFDPKHSEVPPDRVDKNDEWQDLEKIVAEQDFMTTVENELDGHKNILFPDWVEEEK